MDVDVIHVVNVVHVNHVVHFIHVVDDANKSFSLSEKLATFTMASPNQYMLSKSRVQGRRFTNIKQESKAAAFSWTCYSVFSNKL